MVAVRRKVHRVHSRTESCEASAHLFIRVRSYLLHPVSPFNQPSVQPPIYASTPIPRCVVGECALLIPLSQLSQKAGSLSDAEGKRGVLQSFPPPSHQREEREAMENHETRSKAAGVDRCYQLSGVSWVSMSTLHMGHFLLVASHWSTHAWWKRCMQGNLLTSSPSSSIDRQMVHFSSVSSSSSSRHIFRSWGILFLYLCGKVNLSMVVWTAPRFTLPSLSSSCRSSS